MIQAVLIGYVLGSFQTAFFIGKFFGKLDIRREGSSNAGASNVTQVMGWRFGIVTALSDILKAYLAVWLAFRYSGGETAAFLAGTAAVLGHMFPFYLGFRGGKGLACLVGMMLAFEPEIGLGMMLAVFLLTVATDYITVGTLAAYAGLPVVLLLYGKPVPVLGTALLLSLLGIWKHRENVRRILNKEEKGLRATLKKKTGKRTGSDR